MAAAVVVRGETVLVALVAVAALIEKFCLPLPFWERLKQLPLGLVVLVVRPQPLPRAIMVAQEAQVRLVI